MSHRNNRGDFMNWLSKSTLTYHYIKKTNFEHIQLVFYGKTIKYQHICFEFIHWDLNKDFLIEKQFVGVTGG